MSVKQSARAFEYAVENELSPPRRLVLYVMADGADEDGHLWPGQKRLQRLTGLSVSTIRKALREFEEAGILTTQTRLREEGRGRTSNLYVLNFHAVADGDRSTEQPPSPGDRTADQPPGDGGAPRREKRDQPPGDGGPIDRGTVREPSKGTVSVPADADHTTDSDFGILAAGIAAPLRQVAKAKGGNFDPHSVKRACDAYPDRDHAAEAEAFAAWHLSGNGTNAPMRVAGVAFKKWLANGTAVEPGKVRKLKALPDFDREKIAEGLPALAEKWPAVVERLRADIPESTFLMWLEPLRPVGMVGSKIYLTGPEGIRAWVERRYSSMLAAAAEDALGEKVAVLFVPDDAEAAA